MEQKPLDEWMQSPQAAQLLKDKAALMGLLHSPDGKKLAALLQKNNGAALQQAAQRAATGDPNAIRQLFDQLQENKEGMELLSKLSAQLSK